jgi:threonine aldolase
VRPVQSNIVIFDVKAPYTAASFIDRLAEHDILASPFGPQTVRLVTHLDLSESMIEKTLDVLKKLSD